jgi:large subunit ribosomal protein L3
MAKKEGLIGRKLGMTQIFGADGNHIPVTVIEAGPCTVWHSHAATHGYDVCSWDSGPSARTYQAGAGLFKKVNVSPFGAREVRLEKAEVVQGYTVGQAVTVEMFAPGELVDVIGVTKGRGFQGGVKRHNWRGGEATHGSMFHRAPGSIGVLGPPHACGPHRLPGGWAASGARC